MNDIKCEVHFHNLKLTSFQIINLVLQIKSLNKLLFSILNFTLTLLSPFYKVKSPVIPRRKRCNACSHRIHKSWTACLMGEKSWQQIYRQCNANWVRTSCQSASWCTRRFGFLSSDSPRRIWPDGRLDFISKFGSTFCLASVGMSVVCSFMSMNISVLKFSFDIALSGFELVIIMKLLIIQNLIMIEI